MGYYWYEDPLADEDIYNYVKLRQKLDIPIMATEFPAGGLDTYPIWLTEKATDYLRGDIPNKGGLTTMLKTAHLAEAFGLRYEVHHSGNSLNNLANLHLCMALRNTTMWEVLLPDGAHKYGMVKDLEIDKDGLMHAPTEPGLGGRDRFRPDQAQDRGRAAVGSNGTSPAIAGEVTGSPRVELDHQIRFHLHRIRHVRQLRRAHEAALHRAVIDLQILRHVALGALRRVQHHRELLGLLLHLDRVVVAAPDRTGCSPACRSPAHGRG